MNLSRIGALGAAALALSCAALSHSQIPDGRPQPTLKGFVTDPGTPATYRVNDVVVHCTPGSTVTITPVPERNAKRSETICPQPILGESLSIFGKRQGQHVEVEATEVDLPVAAPIPVHGLAVIERVLTPGKESVTVRADGYLVRLSPTTNLSCTKGLSPSLAAVQPNVWIAYSGLLGADGTVQAATAALFPNTVEQTEDRLRQNTDFDASAVDESQRQGAASRHLFGKDPKRLPAHHDDAMQARVEAIGRRLIPAYQQQLAASDPTRIDFRFQLVDDPGQTGEVPLPSGVILVPYQVVQRLENDSELAAVLASGIAQVIQKRCLRAIPTTRAIAASNVASIAAELLVPAGNLPFLIANSAAETALEHRIVEQNDRVSLALMHDAGFDLAEAPRAWWLLSSKKPKPLTEIAMPYRTAYLYSFLFNAWRNVPGTSTFAPAQLSGALSGGSPQQGGSAQLQ